MLVREIWDILVLALCVLGIGVAILIVYTNPHRSLNRFLAYFLVCFSLGQVLQLLGLNYERLACLRAAHVLAGLALVSASLIHDTVLHPASALRWRLKRELFFLIPATLIVVFPITSWWVLQPSVVLGKPARACFFCYLGLRAGLVSWLLAAAIRVVQKGPTERRFDAQNFCALALFLFAAIIGALVARLLIIRDALRWMEIIVGIYYPLVAWMMTSTRFYNFGEIIRIGLRFLISLLLLLAVAFPLLTFAARSANFWLGVTLVIASYPMIFLGSSVAGTFLARFATSSQDQAKAATSSLIETEWSENHLRERFCDIISCYMGGVKVEVIPLASLKENNLAPSQRVLAMEAARTGWLTVYSAHRQSKVTEIDRIQQAFFTENLASVLVSNFQDNLCVLFVGQLSSLKVVTYPVVKFLSELLSTFQLGRHRILLAQKAIYNDRLATIGFIASRASHEARNRLDSVRVALEMLKAGKEGELSLEHRTLLLQELEIFLMDFTVGLDMARTDIGRLSSVPARIIIDEAVTIFAPYARSLKIQVETVFGHERDDVLVDRRLLRQALFNLFRNAAEALQSTPDPRILLQTSSSRVKFLIEIIDNGPGVAPENYDSLFVEFRTTKDSGTGLGLSLCRDMMALMKGSIHYTTPRGKPNACFRLSVPLEVEAEEAKDSSYSDRTVDQQDVEAV
jgi:signal transduction histidine kinase